MTHVVLFDPIKVPPWKRPADWLPLPPRDTQRRSLIGLVAVSPRPTSLGFVVTGCAYGVDWGDGIVEHYRDGEHATHTYVYQRLPASSHCSRGYRQAIVNVWWEPAGPGGALPVAKGLEVTDYTAINDVVSHTTPLLEIQLAGPTLEHLVLSPRNKPSRMCEQVWMRPLDAKIQRINNYSQGLFEDMNSLQSVPEFNVGTLTNLDRTFKNCTSLRDTPHFVDTSAESMVEMFAGCTNLVQAGLLLPHCKDATRMFMGCSKLREVVLKQTDTVEIWQDAFRDCESLPRAHVEEFAHARDMAGMFEGCSALTHVAEMFAPKVTTTEAMFQGCVSLVEVGDLHMSSNMNISYMFRNCYSLKELGRLDFGDLNYVTAAFAEMYALVAPPQGFDTPDCLDFSAMFAGCVNLPRAPQLSTAKGRNFNAVFQNCTLLEQVPAWDLSNVSATSGLDQAFDEMRSCTRFLAEGIHVSFSIKRMPLQVAQLNELFTKLGLVQGNARTIEIGGVIGALQDGLDTTLATSKNWTVAA